MDIPERHPSWLLMISAVLLGCGDQPPPAEPVLAEHSAASTHTASQLEATPAPVVETEAPEISAAMRAAMARTLNAALVELELEPDVSMRLLHDFLEKGEAQQVERLQAGSELPRTIHP